MRIKRLNYNCNDKNSHSNILYIYLYAEYAKISMIRIINEFAVYYKYKIEIIKASISLLLKHLNKLQNTVKHSLISDIALVYKTFFHRKNSVMISILLKERRR